METEKAIPTGYMTVGEVAQKMGVTVRTLQYYDREGLLTPSAISEGGRRLYTDRDLIQLHQILSLKHLGFSLGDIKNRLIPLDTPEAVAKVLDEQATALREKLEDLTEALRELTALRTEVLQMKTVDFKKYADIIVNLRMNNEFYWLIKHFDSDTLDHIRAQFDQDSGLMFMKRFNAVGDEALALMQEHVSPDDDRAQAAAARFWGLVMEFTGGDMTMLPKLMEIGNMQEEGNAWVQRQAPINAYLQPALELYFRAMGMDPFQEESA